MQKGNNNIGWYMVQNWKVGHIIRITVCSL